jgi:uncharacterized protein
MRPIYLLGADEIEEERTAAGRRPGQGAQAGARESKPTCRHLPLLAAAAQGRRSTTVKREEPKVGRNDDCPCGSGKKYKKCCGAE